MKFCLIGEKLSHSWSAKIHEMFGVEYRLVELTREMLPDFLLRNDFDGFNVTIPYKKDVLSLLKTLDETARRTGAVNTVKKTDDGPIGFNTDIFGMEYMLRGAGIFCQGAHVMILGSGGTSQTAQYLCRKQGAKSVVVVSRTGETNYGNCAERRETEIIINTTPVGMYPDVAGCPLDPSLFPNLKGVADCIYNPAETVFLRRAKQRGVAAVNGLPMLVAQAAKAEEIWLDTTFPAEKIAEVISALLQETNDAV